MNFLDLRDAENNSQFNADLCIVGSGFAGLAIADVLKDTGLQVLIVESGGMNREPETEALNEIENVGAHRIMKQDLVRCRIFGGSSHHWTGRARPFDAMDFEKRPWVPNSGWPVPHADVNVYMERAGRYLGLGPHCFDEGLWKLAHASPPRPPLDESKFEPIFWQFSRGDRASEPVHFGRRFKSLKADNVRTLLHANVTHINTTEAGNRIESLDVSTLEKKKARINAKTIVLCCGGIENARLMLTSNRQWARGVGNQHDVVGRYLMDHVVGPIGDFDTRRSARVQDRFGRFWLNDRGHRYTFLHGLALQRQVQEKEHLVRSAVFLFEHGSDNDPWEMLRRLKSGRKQESAAFYGDAEDSVVEGVESPKRQTGGFAHDALGVLRHSPSIVNGLYRRFIKHRPPIVKNDRLDLYGIMEQVPDPESRLTLSDRTDALGLPLSKLNWKISAQEKKTFARMGQLVQEEFKRLNLPLPVLAKWLNEPDNWGNNVKDHYHPMGTTRMSVNPREGVVDENCKVHGIDGFYIAGSSTFPTGGHANPTQTLLALALRLADWLKKHPT